MSKKRISLMGLLTAFILFLGACGGTNNEDAPLQVQFVPTNNDGTMEARGQEFAAYLTEQLGREVVVSVATDFNTIVEAMISGRIDVGIMPPAAYVQARERNGAKAILTSQLGAFDRETGLPLEGELRSSFKGEILVRADSDIYTLEDLIGRNIGTLSASSASGFIFPIVELIDAGIDPHTDVNLVTINDIPSAMTAVLSGQIDANFAFEGSRVVFNAAFSDYDLMEDLRVLHLTEGDIPNDAIAVQPDMDPELIDEIRAAFLGMQESEKGLEIMAIWGHLGYEEADESAYDIIREYIARAAELD